MADKRAGLKLCVSLKLRVSLLAEDESTQLITLASAIAERMDREDADPEISELATNVRPEKVLAQIRESEQQA